MGEFIKNIVIIVIGLVIGFIASAYIFYFVGMAMSLAAGEILGINGEELAQIFAWIGVGVLAAVFITIAVLSLKEVKDAKQVHISEEEFAELFEEDGK